MNVIVRELSKAYGFLWALRQVNFQLRAGDCVALLGPNGAGKTTLLSLLSALVRPTAGEIAIDGKQLPHGHSPLRSRIGLLSPGNHLYEKLTSRENLRFFTSLCGKGVPRERIDMELEQVGLGPWSGHLVSSLSQGMKCRLNIAKWLLLEPQLLLLDEPYGSLDGSGVDLVESYLSRLCADGGIVVMATHNLQRALSLCSRAVVLHQGRVILDEPRSEPWEGLHRAMADFLPRGERWKS